MNARMRRMKRLRPAFLTGSFAMPQSIQFISLSWQYVLLLPPLV